VIDAVIFDLDGTLLESADMDEALYKQAVEDVLGPIEFREHLGDYEDVTDTGILLQTFADNELVPTDEHVGRIKQQFVALLRDYVDTNGPFREVPGARNIVERLRSSRRHHVAIATGGWRASALLKLASAGLDWPDVPLATSDDAVARTDIMLAALKKLDGDPGSVTYFGDGEWDRQACERLGWRFRAVGPGLNGLLSFDDTLGEFGF
jgi:beta-phosphoglucomutase-like phosphatase (HAD superfamily)